MLIFEALERWAASSLFLPDAGQVITPQVKNLNFLISEKARMNACQYTMRPQTRSGNPKLPLQRGRIIY